MRQPFSILLLAILLMLNACRNNSQQPVATADKNGATVSGETSPPDAADLLQVLQGKWQSETDSTYTLEITDTKMHHFNNGKLSFESDIEIDGKGKSAACSVDSIDTRNGWCFVEKGSFDAQCNIVLKCDGQVLQYRALGAANGLLRFKKM